MTEQAQMYHLIFYIGMGLAVATLILSIILFFKLRIPKVIGDLTGSTARKVTNQIRKESENGGQRLKKNQIPIQSNIQDMTGGDETTPLDSFIYGMEDCAPTVDLVEQGITLSGMRIEEDITIVNSDVII